MFADEIRRAIEAANRIALPQVTALLWRAYGQGSITETEAEALSVLIEGRLASNAVHRLGQTPNPTGTGHGDGTGAPRKLVQAPRTGVGSRPRSDASLERRRRWAASGRLPPAIAARFTLAEQAVLSLIAAETARRKDCRMAVEHMAAVAGVSRSTVKNAIRQARQLGLISVEERKVTGWRNDTNVVRIISREWDAWLRLTRRTAPVGGGVKSPTGTPTEVLELGGKRVAGPAQGATERANAGPSRPTGGRVRIARDGGAAGRSHAWDAGGRPA